jgi:hypothetical protein
MILLVTPSLRSSECAEALKQATGEDVSLANTLCRATTLLRTEVYRAVVFDQQLLETEVDDAETIMQHLGTAIPLQISFAVSGVERVVREVRAALSRRKCEQAAARQSAMELLRSELCGTVTALLLQCELALETPGLPTSATNKMREAHRLVQKLRRQLENGVVRFEENAWQAAAGRPLTAEK